MNEDNEHFIAIGSKPPGVAPMIAPTERALLLRPHEVRGILAGRQTQLRRVVRSQSCDGTHSDVPALCKPVLLETGEWGWDLVTGGDIHGRFMRCPLGAPGTQLWCREGFRFPAGRDGDLEKLSPSAIAKKPLGAGYLRPWCPTQFRAGGGQDTEYHSGDWGPWGRWRPSVHMPRWASRLTLEVTDVRVERVQDISEEDALATGASRYGNAVTGVPFTHRSGFESEWNTHAKPGQRWDANPWVWAVTFRV